MWPPTDSNLFSTYPINVNVLQYAPSIKTIPAHNGPGAQGGELSPGRERTVTVFLLYLIVG